MSDTAPAICPGWLCSAKASREDLSTIAPTEAGPASRATDTAIAARAPAVSAAASRTAESASRQRRTAQAITCGRDAGVCVSRGSVLCKATAAGGGGWGSRVDVSTDVSGTLARCGKTASCWWLARALITRICAQR